MPVPQGVNPARFHSMVNALVRDKGMKHSEAEAAAIKFFKKRK